MIQNSCKKFELPIFHAVFPWFSSETYSPSKPTASWVNTNSAPQSVVRQESAPEERRRGVELNHARRVTSGVGRFRETSDVGRLPVFHAEHHLRGMWLNNNEQGENQLVNDSIIHIISFSTLQFING